MKVTVENGIIKVESAYNKAWIARAHELNGKWQAPAWCFDAANEELVRASLMEIYGEDGRPAEKIMVDIKVTEDDVYRVQDLVVGGVVVARRVSRDAAVRMMNGAVIVSGGFAQRGGSMAHPMIDSVEDGTVIRCEIPKAKLEEAMNSFDAEVYTPAQINREALEAEKEALLKRLAEIEALLK